MVQAVDYSFLHKQGFYVDVLFIGIDFDDRDRTKFTNEIATLYNKLNDIGKQKAVILFPVQAIEHWLLCQKCLPFCIEFKVLKKPSRHKNRSNHTNQIHQKHSS